MDPLSFLQVQRLPVTPPVRSSNYPRVRRRDLICPSFSRWSPGVQYQGRSLGKMETNRASKSFQLRLLFFSPPLFIIHLELSNFFWLCLLSWSVLKRLHCRLHCKNFIRSFLENTFFFASNRNKYVSFALFFPLSPLKRPSSSPHFLLKFVEGTDGFFALSDFPPCVRRSFPPPREEVGELRGRGIEEDGRGGESGFFLPVRAFFPTSSASLPPATRVSVREREMGKEVREGRESPSLRDR